MFKVLPGSVGNFPVHLNYSVFEETSSFTPTDIRLGGSAMDFRHKPVQTVIFRNFNPTRDVKLLSMSIDDPHIKVQALTDIFLAGEETPAFKLSLDPNPVELVNGYSLSVRNKDTLY